MAETRTLKEQYMQERQRISRFISRAEKRGYEFNENPAREVIPRTVTQEDVDRLKSYTPDVLYSQATAEQFVIDRNGQAVTEIVSGTERRKNERSEAGRRGYQAHVEAQHEGYTNVHAYRETQTVPVVENSASQSSYAEIAARQAMDEETINSMGYNTLDEMLDDPMGQRFVNYWYKNVYPTLAPQFNVFGGTPVPPTGHTEEDLTDGDERAESEANQYDNARRLEEGHIIYDSLKNKIKQFDSRGSRFLNKMLEGEVKYYGEDGVAEALRALEEKNERLMEQLDELMHYTDYENGGAYASRAFRSLADAINWYNEQGSPEWPDASARFAKSVGDVMEAMEGFDNEE